MCEKVLVDKDDLWTVVSYLWDEEERDYEGQDDHIFRFVLPLAEACGFIKSAEEELAKIHEDLGLDKTDADEGESAIDGHDDLLDELNS